MAVEKVTAVPDSSNNPSWRNFSNRFPSKRFGDVEVPDPEAVTAEAVRLRADPAAAQASYDRLNDPDVLEAIAGHLRTLLKAAELAQIAKQFKQDPGGDVLEARKAYENAINVALGTEKKREHGADDITDQKA